MCVVPSLRPLGVCFLSCGEAHTAALTTVPPSVLFSPTRKSSRFSECRGVFFQNGEVFTFGQGRHGQLGHGSTAEELRPRLVQGLGRCASQICCGR